MAKVEIKQSGACAEVLVNGQKVDGCVTGLTVNMDSACLPEVTMRLGPLEASLKLEDAVLRFPDMPEALERALLEHLKAKYSARRLGLPVIHMDGGGSDDLSGTGAASPQGVLSTMVEALLDESSDLAVAVRGSKQRATTETPAADPMEAVRAMVKRHGGGSGG